MYHYSEFCNRGKPCLHALFTGLLSHWNWCVLDILVTLKGNCNAIAYKDILDNCVHYILWHLGKVLSVHFHEHTAYITTNRAEDQIYLVVLQ